VNNVATAAASHADNPAAAVHPPESAEAFRVTTPCFRLRSRDRVALRRVQLIHALVSYSSGFGKPSARAFTSARA
jgi:hypothetical protein